MNSQKKRNRKLLSILLVLCMVLTIVPITAFAAGVNYIDKISVTYTAPNYKAGDAPQAVASVTEGECSVAYEYWREIEQKTEGSVWTGTGRYWYSDSSKMASLAADKQITQFEAGHHYSYNIVLKTNNGYFISDDTIVSVGGYEWGKAGSDTNLEIKDLSTELRIYSPYSIDLPAASTDEVITTVDIGNVWKNLDASQPVAFTAEVNPNNSACSGKVEIVEEAWEKSTYGESTPITDIIKSTDTPRNPIAGGEYWYSVVLKAKDGYVFSDNVTFICEGTTYTAQMANTSVSDNGKTFTAWEFLNPVTVSDSIGNIGDVDIEGVTFNYEPGDTPKATAYKCDPWDEQYDIEYEYWEEMETNSGGEPVPVKYWYSDEAKNNALAQDKKITAFEEGKTYMYSISLKAKGENKFGNNSSVRVNSTKISSVSVFNSGIILFVTAVKTIKPTAPVQLKHIDVIELNNATISFNVNDKLVFTGKTPDESPYIYQFECWQAKDGAGITSAEFFNQGYENHITSFENGKEYQYILYFKAKEGYTFTRDTKLKINGKYYNYRVSDWEEEPNIDEFQTTWRMYPDLTMTPIGNSQENPITPSEPEKPSQKPGTPTTPTQETENKTEQTKNETNNPKTGDNIAVYISVFAVAVAGITATMIIKKRNLNK